MASLPLRGLHFCLLASETAPPSHLATLRAQLALLGGSLRPSTLETEMGTNYMLSDPSLSGPTLAAQIRTPLLTASWLAACVAAGGFVAPQQGKGHVFLPPGWAGHCKVVMDAEVALRASSGEAAGAGGQGAGLEAEDIEEEEEGGEEEEGAAAGGKRALESRQSRATKRARVHARKCPEASLAGALAPPSPPEAVLPFAPGTSSSSANQQHLPLPSPAPSEAGAAASAVASSFNCSRVSGWGGQSLAGPAVEAGAGAAVAAEEEHPSHAFSIYNTSLSSSSKNTSGNTSGEATAAAAAAAAAAAKAAATHILPLPASAPSSDGAPAASSSTAAKAAVLAELCISLTGASGQPAAAAAATAAAAAAAGAAAGSAGGIQLRQNVLPAWMISQATPPQSLPLLEASSLHDEAPFAADSSALAGEGESRSASRRGAAAEAAEAAAAAAAAAGAGAAGAAAVEETVPSLGSSGSSATAPVVLVGGAAAAGGQCSAGSEGEGLGVGVGVGASSDARVVLGVSSSQNSSAGLEGAAAAEAAAEAEAEEANPWAHQVRTTTFSQEGFGGGGWDEEE